MKLQILTLIHGTFVLVASHDAISILLLRVASSHLIVEGGDVAYAYLYGTIYCYIYIEQPKNSSRRKEKPG